MGMCSSISQDEIGVVQQCGAYKKIAYPGCVCIGLPCICDLNQRISRRIKQLDVRVETKTLDNVFVHVVVAVQFHVKEDTEDDMYNAFYKLSDPTGQIQSYVFDIVRSSVPALELDNVFSAKEEIGEKVKHHLAAQLQPFGYTVLHVLVTDVSPALAVKQSMNEINTNRRLRVAAQDKAEADKCYIVKRAEADAEAKFLQGEGIAKQRKAIIDGVQESVALFTNKIGDVTAKDVMDTVLVTQYFDTLRDLGGRNAKVVYIQARSKRAGGRDEEEGVGGGRFPRIVKRPPQAQVSPSEPPAMMQMVGRQTTAGKRSPSPQKTPPRSVGRANQTPPRRQNPPPNLESPGVDDLHMEIAQSMEQVTTTPERKGLAGFFGRNTNT